MYMSIVTLTIGGKSLEERTIVNILENEVWETYCESMYTVMYVSMILVDGLQERLRRSDIQ